ncbi:MAG: DUF6951 family protein [Candidatus Methanofastidiosia archaeon]
MAEVSVDSSICGFVHKIKGQRKGRIIEIEIDTSCKKIKKMDHLEVPIAEIFDIKDNYVIGKAQELGCSSNCIVPSGILHLCRIEAEILSYSLCKKCGSVSISFK